MIRNRTEAICAFVVHSAIVEQMLPVSDRSRRILQTFELGGLGDGRFADARTVARGLRISLRMHGWIPTARLFSIALAWGLAALPSVAQATLRAGIGYPRRIRGVILQGTPADTVRLIESAPRTGMARQTALVSCEYVLSDWRLAVNLISPTFPTLHIQKMAA